MARILVGVCSNRNDDRFWSSFFKFMSDCNSHYDIAAMIIKDTFLPDAQNKIAECFVRCNYEYLLFLDDDHWGHTKEMLDTLIGANDYVATMKTYQRKYPYATALWDKVGHNAMMPVENGHGYRKVDLTGFPMTLIRRDLFTKLQYPYFKPYEAEGRTWNSDIVFMEDIARLGIKPVGCFQHCLPHDKITSDNVYKYRSNERYEGNNEAWFNILKEREAQGV